MRLLLAGCVLVLAVVGTGAPATEPDPERPSGPPPERNGFSLASAIVPAEKIVAGGPPRDGIRSVDEPEFASLEQTTWAGPHTPVLGVALGDEARAYPAHLLEYHQVVNDRFGDVPVAVTYDPLTGVPRAFRRDIDGRTLRFGVSGLLYNSSFLLYDRETESLWVQFEGRALAGPLAGRTLERVAIRQEALASWLQRHPDSKVLARPEPKRIDYRYSPFELYWVRDEIPYPVEARDRRFHAKELVVGLRSGERTRAYLGSRVTAAGGIVQDSFAGHPVVIEYASEHGVFRWDVPDAVEVTEAYWFAWKAFRPETEVWSPPEDGEVGDADADEDSP